MIRNEINSREMGIVECLVEGRNIFRARQKEILAIVLLIGIPINILLVLAYGLVSGINLDLNLNEIAQGGAAFDMFIGSGQYKTLGLYYFVVMLIQGTFFPLITMAVARVSRDYVCGIKPSAQRAILESFQKGWILIVAAIIHETLVFTGTVLFIFPGIYLQVIFFFYIYSIMLDDKGIIESMRYSNSLVKGYFLKTAVMSIVVYSLNYSFSYIIGWVFSLGQEAMTTSVISGTFATFINCVLVCAITVFYLNRQYLKEGRKIFEVEV